MEGADYTSVPMNRLDFAGRNAIVTGGAQGIGAAIVKRLEASGARVTIWDLDGQPRVDVSIRIPFNRRLRASARSTCWSTTPASPA